MLAQPLRQFDAVVGSVAQPILCQLIDDKNRLLESVIRIQRVGIAATVPGLVWLSFNSDIVGTTIYGKQWELSANILAILAWVAISQAISRHVIWLMVAFGEGKVFFKQSIVGSILAITAFFIGAERAVGVAFALLIQNACMWTCVLLDSWSRYCGFPISSAIKMSKNGLTAGASIALCASRLEH